MSAWRADWKKMWPDAVNRATLRHYVCLGTPARQTMRRSGRVCRSNGFSRGSDFLWRRISAAGRGSRPELAQVNRKLCAPEDRPEQRGRRNRPDFIADLGRATHEQQHRYARDGNQPFAAVGTCWRGWLHRRCSFVIGATGSSCRHRRNQRCFVEEQTLCQGGRSRAGRRTEPNSAAFTMLRIGSPQWHGPHRSNKVSSTAAGNAQDLFELCRKWRLACHQILRSRRDLIASGLHRCAPETGACKGLMR